MTEKENKTSDSACETGKVAGSREGVGKKQTTKTFFLLSLGCPKNEVDAEQMISDLTDAGYESSDDPNDVDYLIVNTCSFIESARVEAIEAILELADYKEAAAERGLKSNLIVTGCLPQMEAEGIYESLPEVDAILGTADYDQIVDLCERLQKPGEAEKIKAYKPGKPGSIAHLKCDRRASADRPYAYLKIAEGCSNTCAFCAIPGIRGRMRSRTIESIYEEALSLARQGFKELVLVAQDTTRYGKDIYGENSLCRLIDKLSEIEDIKWLRLLYMYGDAFSDELIVQLAQNPKLLPYVDIPIQHASDAVLKRMRRRDTHDEMLELFRRLRAEVPELVLRTTVMLGFPGESDEDVEILADFLDQVKFERLGAFIFSAEKNTLAYRMQDKVDAETARRRYDFIMRKAKEISRQAAAARVGDKCEILVEDIADDGIFWLGRSYAEAPDVDPKIYLADSRGYVKKGDFVKAEIKSYDDYDLYAVSL